MMEYTDTDVEELLRRADAAQVRAATMGNPVEMTPEERAARSHLLANAEFFRHQARRSRRA